MKSMDREISLATGIFAGISVQQENYNLIIKGNYEGIYLKKKPDVEISCKILWNTDVYISLGFFKLTDL